MPNERGADYCPLSKPQIGVPPKLLTLNAVVNNIN